MTDKYADLRAALDAHTADVGDFIAFAAFRDAAARPETIRALLAERDALRGALEGAWTLIAQLPPTQDRVEIAQMVCAALAQEQA